MFFTYPIEMGQERTEDRDVESSGLEVAGEPAHPAEERVSGNRTGHLTLVRQHK